MMRTRMLRFSLLHWHKFRKSAAVNVSSQRMATSSSSNGPPESGGGDVKREVDPALYDLDRLIPRGVLHYFTTARPAIAELSSGEARNFVRISNIVIPTVGLFAKFWLNVMNKVQVLHRERLMSALHDRPTGTPLITVANHHSCMDEPLIWGVLDWRELSNVHLMRWALSAHNICYRNKYYATFFTYGKSIPIVRGDGVYQKGMDFTLDRLKAGQWTHIYPEGKVNVSPLSTPLQPLRWGVGRMVAEVAETHATPVVVPIFHLGMDSILPEAKPRFPRIGRRVTVCVGEPLPVKDLLDRLSADGKNVEEKRAAVTRMISEALMKLREEAVVRHAKFVYTADGDGTKTSWWRLSSTGGS